MTSTISRIYRIRFAAGVVSWSKIARAFKRAIIGEAYTGELKRSRSCTTVNETDCHAVEADGKIYIGAAASPFTPYTRNDSLVICVLPHWRALIPGHSNSLPLPSLPRGLFARLQPSFHVAVIYSGPRQLQHAVPGPRLRSTTSAY